MPRKKPKPLTADCYSHGERDWMEYGQQIRAQVLGPALPMLHRAGITPDHITLIAGISGLLFAPLWLSDAPELAFYFLALHIVLDGLDGPLARHSGIASARGSFTDSFADQLVVTAVTIAWMAGSPTSTHIIIGSGYIFLYAIVVALAMVRNAIGIPYAWLIRPRFFVYLALAVEFMTNLPLVDAAMAVSVAILSINAATGFAAVRRKL